MTLPSDIPPDAVPFLETVGYLEADRLVVGSRVSPLSCDRLDVGEPITIGDPESPMPMVLIFGSYT